MSDDNIAVNVDIGFNSDEVNQTSFTFYIKAINKAALEEKLKDWSDKLS